MKSLGSLEGIVLLASTATSTCTRGCAAAGGGAACGGQAGGDAAHPHRQAHRQWPLQRRPLDTPHAAPGALLQVLKTLLIKIFLSVSDGPRSANVVAGCG